LKSSRSGNPYCSKTYCRNGYCGIVAAVSELATFLTWTRSPAFLADEHQCVDANPSARRLLGVSRSQLIARPPRSDVRVDVAQSPQDAAVSNQGLASDRDRLAAA
jgi:PAS domain-containing protein